MQYYIYLILYLFTNSNIFSLPTTSISDLQVISTQNMKYKYEFLVVSCEAGHLIVFGFIPIPRPLYAAITFGIFIEITETSSAVKLHISDQKFTEQMSLIAYTCIHFEKKIKKLNGNVERVILIKQNLFAVSLKICTVPALHLCFILALKLQKLDFGIYMYSVLRRNSPTVHPRLNYI
jgi:hypothetical protein